MEELEVIVQRMIDAGESEDNIALVIKEYNSVAKPKQEPTEKPEVPKGVEAGVIDNGVSDSTSAENISSSESKTATEPEWKPTETSREDLLSNLKKVDLTEQYRERAISKIRENYEKLGKTNYQISEEEIESEIPNIIEDNKKVKTAIDKINSEPNLKQKKSYLVNLVDNLKAGSTSLGIGLASIPETLYDIGAMPQNLFSYLTGVDIEASSSKFKEKFDITNPVLDYYLEENKKLQGVVSDFNEKYESTSVYENIKSGNYLDAFELLGSGIAQSAPISVSMMVGGAATNLSKLSAGGTAVFTGINRQDVEEESPEMSELEKTVKSIGLAGAETVFEALGSGSLGRVYKDIILKEGVENGSRIFKEGLVEMYQRALKKHGAKAAALGEGIEEVATTMTQNLINNKPIFEGVEDSFIQGVGGGAIYGAPINVNNVRVKIQKAYQDRQVDKVLESDTNDFNKVSDAFMKESKGKVTTDKLKIISKDGSYERLEKEVDYLNKNGEITQAEVEEIKQEFLDTHLALTKVNGVGLNENDATEAVRLIKRKEVLKAEIKNLDDAIATNKKLELEEIDNKLVGLVNKKVQGGKSADKSSTATTDKAKTVTKDKTKPINKAKDTQEFFGDVVQGVKDKYKPSKPYEYEQEFTENEEVFKQKYDQKRGNFDEHIATSIPTFRDTQIKKGNAVIETLSSQDNALVYDIGGSEGGWVKTITEVSKGKIRSINLEPNDKMKEAFDKNKVKGSDIIQEAFNEGFDNIPTHKPKEKADVVHESMVFQFITPERTSFLDEITKNYLKEDGLFISEEKFKLNDESQYKANESLKDIKHKSKYYTEAQQKLKGEDVLVGMDKNQANYDDYISELEKRFDNVGTYWTAGNFRGVVATNSKDKFDKFMKSIGDNKNEYTAEPTKPQPKIKTETKKLADNIRKLKVNSSLKDSASKLSSTALFEVAWDGALETVATTIELTGNFAQGLHDGIQQLKNSEWYLKLSDKGRTKAERMFREDINRQYGGEEINQSFYDSTKASIDKMQTSVIQKLIDKYHIVRKAIGQNFDITDDKYNFSQAEINMHGKAANDIDLFEKELESIMKEISDKKLSVQNVSDYMYAKHAEERNKYIKENVDPENEFGSGMTPQEANKILNETFTEDQKADLESLSQKFYDIIAGTRTIMLEHGLITEEQHSALAKFYENYVPLQGFENQDIKGGNQIEGKKLDIAGHLLERSSGRSTRADNVVSNIIAARISTTLKARKNEVLQTLYELGKKEPNNGVFSLYTDETLPKHIKVDRSGNKIEQKENARVREDYVGVKVDGEQYWVKFKNAELGRVLNVSNIEKSNIITKLLRSLNRYLSVTLTTLNPEFVISNFSRDIQTAVVNLMAESDINPNFKSQEIAKAVVKDTGKAIKAIMINERYGKTDTEMQQYYKEFKEDGAKTGWANQADLPTITRRMETMVKHFDAKGITVHNATAKVKALGKFINDVNTSVENGVRLAAYVNARKVGLTRPQAAAMAKELTVNFNKSGEYGTVLNSMYLFFNASIQGNLRFIKAMTTLKKTVREDGSVKKSLNRGQKLALGLTAFASVLTLLNQAMSDDDDDGEPFYKKIPDFEKERNLILMNPLNGRDYWKIPLPYGYNIFHNFGTIAAEVASGQRGVGDGIGFLTSAAIGAFSPVSFGGGKSETQDAIINAFTPTIAKPIVDLARNEDYFGSQIYNENFPVGTPKPDASMGRRTTPQTFKEISMFLNSLSGGNEYESGSIDLSPESMYYIYKFAIGGTGKFLQNVGETAVTTGEILSGQDKKLEIRKVPFARKVYGEPNQYVDQTTFFDNYNKVRQKVEAIKAKAASDKDMENKRNISAVEKAYSTASKQLKELRKKKKATEQIIDPIKRTEKFNILDDKYYSIIKKTNRVYNEKMNQ